MIVPILAQFFYDQIDSGFISSGVVTIIFGVLFFLSNLDHNKKLTLPQAFLLTALSWLSIAIFGSLPFIFSDIELTLTDAFFSRFDANDRAQFRRTVRYLKRWKDEKFPSDGNTAPIGIGITVAAYDELQPTYADIVAGKPDDLLALCKLIEAILNRFAPVWDEDDQKWIKRLEVTLPIEPWSDLFEQMTNKQMVELEAKLITLLEALNVAIEDVDPVEACKNLQKVFGDDFPVPEKEETGKKHAPAIVSSSSSA